MFSKTGLQPPFFYVNVALARDYYTNNSQIPRMEKDSNQQEMTQHSLVFVVRYHLHKGSKIMCDICNFSYTIILT